jgi:hypothetical protein
MECHLFILFASRTRITSGLARIYLCPPENICRCQFCARTPGSRTWRGNDFATIYRKSFSGRLKHSVDFRLHYEGLKVGELSMNVF